MVKTRFAPTPSGFLHSGNAASFVLTWLLARVQNGSILLRIDDLDRERMREGYVDDVFRTLDWLRLDYDSGPEGPDDFHKNWSQVLRLHHYDALLDQLTIVNDQVFGCDCSRSQLPDGPYPGTCISKNISLNTEGVAWRIKSTPSVVFDDLMMGSQHFNLDSVTGPFVIRSRNGRPAYQVASLSDDLQFGINLIVRGQDLLPSTASQLYLSFLLKKPSFGSAQFVHHPLVTDPQSGKLSKSEGAGSVKSLQESGAGPEVIYALVAGWLGCDVNPNDCNLASLAEMVKGRFGL